MPLPQDTSQNSSIMGSQTDADYATFQMLNLGGSPGGPTVPPSQQGDFRIPRPENFQIVYIKPAAPLGTPIAFAWTDITDPKIQEYRIFVQYAINANAEPVQVGVSERSPCELTVVVPSQTNAVFYLRPYLANGQTLPIGECPSCTETLPNPALAFSSAEDGTTYVKITGTSGKASTLTERLLTFINASLQTTAVMGTNGTSGTLQLSDGTGSGGLDTAGEKIDLDGSTGLGRFYGGGVQLEDGTAGDTVNLLPGTSGTASAGAAALPANPVGFLLIKVGGTSRKVPYYAV